MRAAQRAAPATARAPTEPITTAIPDALRTWRQRTPGAVIQIGQRGVVLHALGSQARTFPSIAAAVEAVA
ncbi:MAG TPA: hypothetical protein VHW01_21700 [Polyangiaceae bacterium]|jgi:hypothetical protein|nr:hypothetical protein [Polyangiaceae bacterium]